MHNPVATYRIQFNKDFTFKDLEHIIPYLHQLGVSTIYASPIFEATPGSTHGYDVVNPSRIGKYQQNPQKIQHRLVTGYRTQPHGLSPKQYLVNGCAGEWQAFSIR